MITGYPAAKNDLPAESKVLFEFTEDHKDFKKFTRGYLPKKTPHVIPKGVLPAPSFKFNKPLTTACSRSSHGQRHCSNHMSQITRQSFAVSQVATKITVKSEIRPKRISRVFIPSTTSLVLCSWLLIRSLLS